MKPISLALVPVIASALLSFSFAAEKDWTVLFDGESVDAWRAYRGDDFPSGSWEVREGVLTSIGGARVVDIITRETFTDFELELEWRVEPRGNSGIFYRVNEDAARMWHFAPEIQILDDGPQTPPLHATGSLYDLLPPGENTELRPVGEFNETRIRVHGNEVEHWLNGEKILAYDLDAPELKKKIAESKFGEFSEFGRTKDGHIGLQHHGDTVGFRNIRIRALSSSND